MIIGILKCDTAHPDTIEKIGDYDIIFHNFLKLYYPSVMIKSYDVVNLEYPENIDEVDGYIITGSRYSVYDKFLWIDRLKVFIQKLNYHQKKMVGICFGHQIIIDALGGKVEKSNKGWEISVSDIWLNPIGQQYFDIFNENNNKIRLQQMHKDVVTELGNDMMNIGSSGLCEIQGIIKKNYILTLQAHPEYVPLVVKNLIESRLNIIPEMIVKNGLERLYDHCDQTKLSEIICKFFTNNI